MENKSTYFICEVPRNHPPLIFTHSSSLSLPDRITVSGRLGGVEALEYHLHMTVGLGLSRPNTLWYHRIMSTFENFLLKAKAYLPLGTLYVFLCLAGPFLFLFHTHNVSSLSEMRQLQLQLVCIYVCLTHYIKGILPDVCYGYSPYESLTMLYHAPWFWGLCSYCW